jgi:hypothetical protein
LKILGINHIPGFVELLSAFSSQEQQKIVFESFCQAESGMTRRFGGTGLGLVIARQLVQLRKNRIADSGVSIISETDYPLGNGGAHRRCADRQIIIKCDIAGMNPG